MLAELWPPRAEFRRLSDDEHKCWKCFFVFFFCSCTRLIGQRSVRVAREASGEGAGDGDGAGRGPFDRRAAPRRAAPPANAALHSLCLYTTSILGSPGWIFQLQLIIFKCTSTKIKIWAIRMQTQLSDMRSALLFFPSSLFSNLHFTLRRRVSDWAWRTHPFLQFALAVPAGVFIFGTAQTHTTRAHTHTPPHTRAIQFPVETERKYPLRKRKKKTETKKKINKYKPCCCLLYWCPFLTPSSAPAAGPLSQFRGPFSWRRRGRRRENYKLKQLHVSPAVDTQRSQVWFMVLAPTMRGK